jgi:maleate isomerase
VGDRKRLGILTPSSNTILEPTLAAMLASTPEITAHFARFKVTEISLGATAISQFDIGPIVDAAMLLADARVDVISWSGTSSCWLGVDADRQLCAEIERRVGVPSTTSVLALIEAFRLRGVQRYALVTPYLDEIQAKILANFADLGLACVGERHLGDRGNFSFAEIDETTIASMIRAVAAEEPQAITTFCTNLRAARVAAELEAELGIPIYDTVSTGLWGALRLAGADATRTTGWGTVFAIAN